MPHRPWNESYASGELPWDTGVPEPLLVEFVNSGGASGKSDLKDAAITAIINKRAGGTGLISGRKVFQKPMEQGIQLLHTIQDIYLEKRIDIA